MPQQEITVNGHNYVLYPDEAYTPNPDYLVAIAGAQAPCGTLMWEGNGTTTFNYVARDSFEETLGSFATWQLAVQALDAKLFPSG